MRIALVGAALGAAACGSRDSELFPGGLTGIVAIDVTPPTAQLDVTDLANPGGVQLTATGTFLDGSERDVTALVRWATDPPYFGDVDADQAGLWRPSARAGGIATVAALANDVAGSAAVTVSLHLVLDDPNAPIPEGARGVFDPPTPVVVGDATHSPTIAYPANETMFPIDVSPILFQQVPRGGTDVYRFHFQAPYVDLAVLTTADRWQPDAMQWGMLALTAANGTVAMAVDAVDLQAPGTIWESATIDLYYAQSPVGGLVSYWSDATMGIFTAPLGGAAAASYPVAPDHTCVGCHAVSRDGKRLAVSYNQTTLQQASLPDRATVSTSRVDAAWITYSPDRRKVFVANKGKLSLHDAMTGMQLPMPGLPAIANATMPDWSPRGDAIAFAQCAKPVDRDVENCSILTVGYDGTSFSPAQTLVPATSMLDNNYEPRYSPDGKWIAFVHATGSSKDQTTAEVRLIPATGGPFRDLVRGNHRVGPLDGQTGLTNAMPAWAPANRPGVQWLVLTSTRDYGIVATGPKPEQLWIVAVDARLTGDPSFAAFRFPAQDVTRRNHTPGWALDPTAACTGGGEVCDGFDNDCDGVIDNDCRPCGPIDICFDGIDNDCDGLVDPGCIQ